MTTTPELTETQSPVRLEWENPYQSRSHYLLVNDQPFVRLDDWGEGDVQEWRLTKRGEWQYVVAPHLTLKAAKEACESAAREWLKPLVPDGWDALLQDLLDFYVDKAKTAADIERETGVGVVDAMRMKRDQARALWDRVRAMLAARPGGGV